MKLVYFTLLSLIPCLAYSSPTAQDLFKDKDVRALAIAGANGDTNRIDRLLAQDVDVNAVGKDDCTPIGWTLMKGNKVGYEHLLKNGANPNTRFGDRASLLTLAIDTDDPFYLKKALESGGDPDQTIKTSYGECSLVHYVSCSLQANPEMMRILVNYEATGMPGEDNVSDCATLNEYENVYILLDAGFSFPTNRNAYSLIERIENRAVHPDDPESEWRDKVAAFLSDREIKVTPKEWQNEDQPKIINLTTE